MFKQKHPIVLASGSPRRKNYLERYQLHFRILVSDISEGVLPQEEPLVYAERMAKEKNNAVLSQCSSDEIVISADTIVVFQKQILGKPSSKEEAIEVLKQLSGKQHEVISAYKIYRKACNTHILRHCTTTVCFKNIPDEQIRWYVETKEPMDKAGSYSIQGIGTFLVDHFQGSYNTVVGLPIEMLLEDFFAQDWLQVN